ncbi:MAG: EamA family transporter [Ignavibacteriae bacterium]|nr:MAG: EamA family transporter [Ignavibacteriota bacterium]
MPYLGELSALITAFLWSGTSFAFTNAAKRIGSLQLNVNRIILATIFLFFIILIANINYKLSDEQIYYLALSGFAGLVLGDSFLFKSFQLIGARLGMLLMALVPAFSSILALVFLGEHLLLISIIGMIITLSGISIVIMERSKDSESIFKTNKLGVLFGVLGALGQASGLVLAKFAFEAGSINGFVATFVRLLSAVVIIFPLALVFRRYKNPIKVYTKDTKALWATLVGTILGPVLGITGSLIAIANAQIGIASTLMSTMPIIMLPIVRYYYKETLSWRAIIGAMIAIVGVAILFLV